MNVPSSHAALAVLASLLLAPTGWAGEVITLGGPGGLACSNTNDPPTLADGVTPASAELTYSWDPATHQLTLVVENTSPVTPGVPSPIITSLWLNLPDSAVTSVSLTGQDSAGGAAPHFALVNELAELSRTKRPRAGCLGSHDLHLRNAVPGGIANPAADLPGGPPGSAVLGPVTFTFHVDGPGVGSLNASAFAGAFSRTPPGRHRVTAAAHFQSGGRGAAYSDLIGPAMGCNPSGWMVGEPKIGTTVTLYQSAFPGCHGCLAMSPEPGPTDFGLVVVPLGFPMFPIIPTTAPESGPSTLDFPIPNNPNLVGQDFFLAVVTVSPSGEFAVSEGFTVVVTA